MNFFEFVKGMFANRILFSALIAWAVAQGLKYIIDGVVTHEWKAERLCGSGGMPSSHSATVSALVVATGCNYAPTSFEFAIAFLLAVIVIYDARGVRLETGRQAEIINVITRFLKKEEGDIELPEEELKELIGHTPLQVAAGTILGIVTGALVH